MHGLDHAQEHWLSSCLPRNRLKTRAGGASALLSLLNASARTSEEFERPTSSCRITISLSSCGVPPTSHSGLDGSSMRLYAEKLEGTAHDPADHHDITLDINRTYIQNTPSMAFCI